VWELSTQDYVDSSFPVLEGALRFVLARAKGGVPLVKVGGVGLDPTVYDLEDLGLNLLGRVELDGDVGHE
jgi:hypothetical protein